MSWVPWVVRIAVVRVAEGWELFSNSGGNGESCVASRQMSALHVGSANSPIDFDSGQATVTKVTHVITRMIVGGAQENTLHSVEGLRGRDFDVELLTGSETGTEGNLLADSSLSDVVFIPHMVRSIRPLSDARAFRELVRHLRLSTPDIVHTHSAKGGILGSAAARNAGVGISVHTIHGLAYHQYQMAPLRFSYRTINRFASPFTDFYVSVSDNIRDRAIADGIGVPERHMTIRSGFPTAQFRRALTDQRSARRRLGLHSDRPVVGVVARLFPLKGHDDVLKAARRVMKTVPDVQFAFVGSGPLRDELEQMASDWGLAENVVFVGRLKAAEMPLAFSAFDVLVHASLREGLARVLPQAVLAEVPVVVYDLDGASEVVQNDVNGYLLQPRDTAAMADRITALLRDESLRSRLAGAGWHRVADEFSVDTMVSKLTALYTALLAERDGAAASSWGANRLSA
jgi:glycosyltransferase involved in cell wall biosynthesis